MAAPEPVDWLERGRDHHRAGRTVDAMLCFQRAVKATPKEPGPRLHLGAALRDLGFVRDAFAVWREAAAIAPHDVGVQIALAEAALDLDDPGAAREAAARALLRDPGDDRAQALHAIAGWLHGLASSAPPPAAAVVAALAREPRLLGVAAVAGVLARALDASPRVPGGDALFALAAARDFLPGEHEALRRIVLAATSANAPSATDLRRRYAALCTGTFAAPAPLVWPRRTAGSHLRVVVMVGATEDPVAVTAVAALAALPRIRFDVTLAVIGSAELPAWCRGAGVAAWAMLTLPSAPESAARRIAALDPDVIVDLGGLDSAIGPLLAARPARAILTLAALRAPLPALLHDGALPDGAALAAALEDMQARLPPDAGEVPDAAGMAAAWDAAVRAHQRGETAAAHEAYGRVLALQPGFAQAHYLRGVLHRDAGNTAAARGDFALALEGAPRYVDARVAAANAALDDREPQVAVALCAPAQADAAEPPALLRAWGLAELALRRGASAQALFARALAREPADGDTHYNHGVALQMQKNRAEAARAYQRALAFKPDLIAADFNLGVLFQEQGATAAAAAAYGTVLAQDAHHAAAYRNLGETLLAAGNADAALASFRRFEVNCPEALALAVQALEVLQHHGDFAGIDRYLGGLAQQRYRAADDVELCDSLEQLLYLLLFFDVEPAVVLNYATMYDRALRAIHGPPLAPRSARRPGRLRIGYLSADLRGHVMGKMTWHEVQHHDRARFALHFYSLANERDEWTARFEGIAESFVVLAEASEREAALRIREDDLDLLVDLSTHTRGARPGILALKPARIQITHVASAGTVGLSTIDFKLTDRYADVAQSGAHQLEALLPMAGCVYPFRHVAPAVAHPFSRHALGLAADAILIGAFFTPLKLSRRCLALWRDVLLRIPHARLVFSPANPAFRDSYVRLAAAGGIPPERLAFVPQGRSDAENQARYTAIDFVLDPMPYGGVNGTLEALDMGVPVVTLVGTRHGERSSYSILANLGVMHTVAHGVQEYADIAVRLASEPAFMREVRAAIRAGLAGSVLADAAGRTRHLEAAYLQALALRAPEVLTAAGV